MAKCKHKFRTLREAKQTVHHVLANDDYGHNAVVQCEKCSKIYEITNSYGHELRELRYGY